MGEWTTATGKWFRDEAEDMGMQTAQTMKFYGIASAFESFSNEGKDLILQYQVKYEKDLVCGGGYLKVGPYQSNLTLFGEPTPYNIMFGPDQCNTDKRTHLIFSYNGKNHLKKKELPFMQEGEGHSHLYRLVLRPDSTVRVEVDQDKLYEGSLKDDWDILPPRELIDPADKKPPDWVDQAQIDDLSDVKPADWVDEKKIRDPTSSRPEEWDDDEDGEYEAPLIDNPEYKGQWSAKKVDNPAYRGAWEARKIPNPDFVDDVELYKYGDFGYVGVDVWQVKGGTIFDNILITDDIAEADKFAEKWKALSEVEKSRKEQAAKADEDSFAKFRAARAAREKAAEETQAASGKGRKAGVAEDLEVLGDEEDVDALGAAGSGEPPPPAAGKGADEL
mmetsp:Transcript_121585/g.330311  ORF Transcript_121585/g.330311 Transcript_121585/m.330311 type:complete len:390 (+) Transcript_121585:152-1321(+)